MPETLEDWLRQSSGPPPKKEDAKRHFAETRVRMALAMHPELRKLPLAVYAKGSFVNRTNISLDSDVDVVVECGGPDEFFYFDLDPTAARFAPWQLQIASRDPPCAPYELKQWVYEALARRFGEKNLVASGKAVRVHASWGRLAADVVPAFAYRLYHCPNGYGPRWFGGHLLFCDDGPPVQNWPAQHLEHGNAKDERTDGRYKQSVRALKRVLAALRAEGHVPDKVSSFFVESLVFNVPDQYFRNERHAGDMRNVLDHIFNATFQPATCARWLEVNCIKRLFGPHQRWDWSDAHRIAALSSRWLLQ
jgi:hypothetical protein